MEDALGNGPFQFSCIPLDVKHKLSIGARERQGSSQTAFTLMELLVVIARHHQGAIHATFGGSVSYVKLADWEQEVHAATRNRLWCYPGSPLGR